MRIPDATLAWWTSTAQKPATQEEVARVATAIGPNTPDDYLSFLATYGFARWDIDVPDTFEYRRGEAEQTIFKRASIIGLWRVDHIERMAADIRDGCAGSLPLYYPNTHFPIGTAGGQSQVLLELEPTPGRVWYWPEREDVWGEGTNTELGFVAESFGAFIEGLRLED